MLRTLIRVGAAVMVLAVVLLAVLALVLPRLVQTEEFDRTVRSAAERALGSPVDWQGLDVGLFPPRVMIDRPVLERREGESSRARLEVASVDLRLALLPILQRRIAIDSLVLRDLNLVVTRSESGWEWPVGGSGETEADTDTEAEKQRARAADETTTESEETGSGFDLAFRELRIENGRIVVHDETAAGEATWIVEAVQLLARGSALSEPVDVEASARLRSGDASAGEAALGGVSLRGQASLAGAYDLEVTLDAIRLEPFARTLADLEVAGLAGGTVSLAGQGGALAGLDVDVDVTVAAVSLTAAGVLIEGDLALQAQGGGATPIDFQGALALPDRARAQLTGRRGVDGAIEARVELESVELSRYASALVEALDLSGQATGHVALVRTAAGELGSLAADLRVPNFRLVRDRSDVAGAFDLVAGFAGDDGVDLAAGLTFADGGRIQAKGTSSRQGVLALDLELAAFDLTNVRAWLPDPEMELGGKATGTGRILGPAADPERVTLDAKIAGGLLRMPDYVVTGPFALVLDALAPLSERPQGRLDLDLTAATLDYANRFKKRAGERAHVVTRFSTNAAGDLVFESDVKLRDVDGILLQGALGKAISVALTTPSFDVGGWSDTLPVLKEFAAQGELAFERFRIAPVEGAPSQLAGAVALNGFSVQVADVGRVALRGRLVGEGTALRAQDLTARLSGLTMGMTGTVDDPFGETDYRLALRSLGETETNELLSSLSSVRDTLYGALDLRADLTGSLGGSGSFLDTLGGNLTFAVGRDGGGRLRGVSILQRVLDQIPILGGVARLAEPFRGGRSVADYFREDFQILEGDFEVSQGILRARSMRLAYDGYEANLIGSLRLADFSIDMTGDLLLKSDLVGILSGVAGAKAAMREPLRIPLARVTRTLSDPKVTLTTSTLAAVPRVLLRTEPVETLLRKGVDEVLGRVLGGGRDRRDRREAPAEPPAVPPGDPSTAPDKRPDVQPDPEPDVQPVPAPPPPLPAPAPSTSSTPPTPPTPPTPAMAPRAAQDPTASEASASSPESAAETQPNEQRAPGTATSPESRLPEQAQAAPVGQPAPVLAPVPEPAIESAP